MLAQDLPPVVQRLADRAWLDRFINCFDALAERLASADFEDTGPASCTGDEMALHLVIRLAEDLVADGVLDPAGEPASPLPVVDEDDPDFNLARDALFADHDVLALFQPALDGIEDPGNDLNRRFRMANLHPTQWFIPFGDDDGKGPH